MAALGTALNVKGGTVWPTVSQGTLHTNVEGDSGPNLLRGSKIVRPAQREIMGDPAIVFFLFPFFLFANLQDVRHATIAVHGNAFHNGIFTESDFLRLVML